MLYQNYIDYIPEAQGPDADAMRWLQESAPKLAIVHDGSSERVYRGLLLLRPDGCRWTMDGQALLADYSNAMAVIVDCVLAECEAASEPAKRRKEVAPLLKQLGKTKRLSSMPDIMAQVEVNARILEAAGVECGIRWVAESEIDAPGHYLGCDNGVLDLSTGALLTGPEAAACYVTRSVGYDYLPLAEIAAEPLAMCESLYNRAPNIATEVTEFLLRAQAWALRGRPPQWFISVYDYGQGNGGKTSLLKAATQTLGNAIDGNGYGAALDIDTLKGKTDKGQAGRASPELEAMAVARMGFVEEAAKQPMNTERLKWLTGQAEVTYRCLYRNPVTAAVQCMMFLASNALLRIDYQEPATLRRYLPIQVPELPVDQRNPAMAHAWNAADAATIPNRQALLALLVATGEGMTAPPTPPQALLDDADKHAADNLSAESQWVMEHITPGIDTDKLATTAVYAAYTAMMGKPPFGGGQHAKGRFTTEVTRRHGQSTQKTWLGGKTATAWHGLRLSDEAAAAIGRQDALR